jgi:hypothetical protein
MLKDTGAAELPDYAERLSAATYFNSGGGELSSTGFLAR